MTHISSGSLPLGLVARKPARANNAQSPRKGRQHAPPKITVHRPQTTNAATSGALQQLRAEFVRSESRDTYKAAAGSVEHILNNATADQVEPLHLECMDLVKTLSTPWGVRFGGWVLQNIAMKRPHLCAAHISVLGGTSFPALLRAAVRDDDKKYVLDTVNVVLVAVQPCFLEVPSEAFSFNRYFYPLLAPLVQSLLSHGVDQAWAADGCAMVLHSSDEMLTGAPHSITGPCNGELEEALQPVFALCVGFLAGGLAARVHDQALCPFLRLIREVLHAALSLATVHADLYSANELLGMTQKRFVSLCLTLLESPSWKVRLEVLCVLKVLTRNGLGSRWFIGDRDTSGGWVRAFAENMASVSRTDKIATVRDTAKEVMRGLAPAGQYEHTPSPPHDTTTTTTAVPSPRQAYESPRRSQPIYTPQEDPVCKDCGRPPFAESDKFCAYCGSVRGDVEGEPVPKPPPAPPAELSVLDRVAVMLLAPRDLDLAEFRALLLALCEADLHKVALNIARRVGWSNDVEAKHSLLDTLLTSLDVLFAVATPHFSQQHLTCLRDVLSYAARVPQFEDVARDALHRLPF